MSVLPDSTDPLWRDFLESIHGRDLTIDLTVAHERRLAASLARDCEDWHAGTLDSASDLDLALALCATSECGLLERESAAGVRTDLAGHERALPRAKRAPVRLRALVAWRAAVTAWRSS